MRWPLRTNKIDQRWCENWEQAWEETTSASSSFLYVHFNSAIGIHFKIIIQICLPSPIKKSNQYQYHAISLLLLDIKDKIVFQEICTTHRHTGILITHSCYYTRETQLLCDSVSFDNITAVNVFSLHLIQQFCRNKFCNGYFLELNLS